MDLFVFTPDYNPLGILSSPVSISYTEKYQSRGEFEVHLPLNEVNASLVKSDRVILFDSEEGIAGVIKGVKSSREKTSSQIIVKGWLCETYLYQRICWGLYSRDGTPQEVMRDMVYTQITSPTDRKRAIPDLVLGSLTKGLEGETHFQSTGGVVGDNLESICSTSSLGFRVRFLPTQRQMQFIVYSGTDRTLHQKKVPQCVFSSEYENLLDSYYQLDSMESKNVALVAGEGEGSLRKLVQVGDESGKLRKEVFVDARDLQSSNSDGFEISPEEYKSLLTQRGMETLSELEEKESFDCTVNPQGNIQFNIDYFLGDRVTLIDSELGVQLDATISEVEHYFSPSGSGLFITFGFGPLTLAQKLKVKVV